MIWFAKSVSELFFNNKTSAMLLHKLWNGPWNEKTSCLQERQNIAFVVVFLRQYNVLFGTEIQKP